MVVSEPLELFDFLRLYRIKPKVTMITPRYKRTETSKKQCKISVTCSSIPILGSKIKMRIPFRFLIFKPQTEPWLQLQRISSNPKKPCSPHYPPHPVRCPQLPIFPRRLLKNFASQAHPANPCHVNLGHHFQTFHHHTHRIISMPTSRPSTVRAYHLHQPIQCILTTHHPPLAKMKTPMHLSLPLSTKSSAASRIALLRTHYRFSAMNLQVLRSSTPNRIRWASSSLRTSHPHLRLTEKSPSLLRNLGFPGARAAMRPAFLSFNSLRSQLPSLRQRKWV